MVVTAGETQEWEKSGAGKSLIGPAREKEVWVGREKSGEFGRQHLEGTRQAEKKKAGPDASPAPLRRRYPIRNPADRAASQPPPASRHHLFRHRPDLQSRTPPIS